MRLYLINLIVFLIIHSIVKAQTNVLVDPRDGKEYKVVEIGSQIWMAENMAYKIQTSEVYTKYKQSFPEYSIYDYADSNFIKYGALYEWKVAQKVCPIGWHLPSKIEYDALLSYVGEGDAEKAYKALIVGGGSGFNALMGGFDLGKFTGKTAVGAFWSSTEIERNGAVPLNVSKYYGKAFTSSNIKKFVPAAKSLLLSVRCIKD